VPKNKGVVKVSFSVHIVNNHYPAENPLPKTQSSGILRWGKKEALIGLKD
jgi:hypothetical protein